MSRAAEGVREGESGERWRSKGAGAGGSCSRALQANVFVFNSKLNGKPRKDLRDLYFERLPVAAGRKGKVEVPRPGRGDCSCLGTWVVGA